MSKYISGIIDRAALKRALFGKFYTISCDAKKGMACIDSIIRSIVQTIDLQPDISEEVERKKEQ